MGKYICEAINTSIALAMMWQNNLLKVAASK